MKTNFTDIDELLVKQLTGEATRAEQAHVQQWLAADAANRKYFDQFKLIWEESAHLASTTEVDENAAWDRFRELVANPPRKKTPVIAWNSRWLQAAAILVLVAGIAWLSQYLLTGAPGEIPLAIVEAGDAVKSDTLPDGSQVILNKHSRISYPSRFSKKERPVELNGEAFFSVMPDKEKPFLVQVQQATVRVVGTSFNVRSHGDSIEVIVETGTVEVSAQQQTVTLHAGEKVLILPQPVIMQKQPVNDQLHNYYRSKEFLCENTPLWRLAEVLEKAYNVTIVIEREELRNLPLTTTFNNEDLDTILSVVQDTFETYGIVIAKENGQIILR